MSKRKIEMDELSHKTVAIDAYNVLYQFITTIRQPDGTPLKDSEGNVTSHLSGLFYRTTDLISHGIRPIYVFDGLPSVLKQKALEARTHRREEALTAWRQAVKEGDLELARTKAMASATVNRAITKSARELLDRMGVYYINAPSEGEAQASVMCREGLVDVVASQDYDTLLLGAPLIARNLALSGRRKLPNKNVYVEVQPELVDLGETLRALGVTQRQLVWIGLMLGTDFNEGIKGIGPKNALKIARSARSMADIEAIVREKYNGAFEVDPKEVIGMFEKPEVDSVKRSDLEDGMRRKPDAKGILEFMCDEHGFSEERISKYVAKLVAMKGEARQKGIGGWM